MPVISQVTVPQGNISVNPTGNTVVQFDITLPDVEVSVLALITLCIKLKSIGAVIFLYYFKKKTMNPGDSLQEVFQVQLPNGSEILESVATVNQITLAEANAYIIVDSMANFN